MASQESNHFLQTHPEPSADQVSAPTGGSPGSQNGPQVGTADSPSGSTAGAPKSAPGSRRRLERRHERGRYAYFRGDYSVALVELEKTSTLAFELRDYARYVDSCTDFLRILAEREEFAKINRIEQRILRLLSLESSGRLPDTVEPLSPKLKSKALYVLGICNCYQEARHDLAMQNFRAAIDIAVGDTDKGALAAPLYGAATVHYARGLYTDALRELERLDILLSCLELPDLNSASALLRAMIYRNQEMLDQALRAAWIAFDSLKHHPHLVLYLHTLCVLGTVYTKKGDFATARLYLDLADRSLKREEFPRIARLVDEAIANLEANQAPLLNFDLIFDRRSGILIEKTKGEIRFDGQFVLRDLLRAFLEAPGKVFTKEQLVETVWREEYAPHIHDNKIYVTIRRLRSLLGPETKEAGSAGNASAFEYIQRAKTGYFLNPKTKVQINDGQVSFDKTAPKNRPKNQ